MKQLLERLHLNTLKAQLTTVLFFVSLLSGIACSTVLYLSSVETLNENAIEQNAAQTAQLAYVLNYQLDELSQVSQSLATSDLTAQMAGYRRLTDYASVKAFSEYVDMLKLFAISNTLAESTFVFFDDGVIVGCDESSNIFLDESVHLRQVKDRITIHSDLFDGFDDTFNRLMYLGNVRKRDFYYLDSPIVDYPGLAFGYQHPVDWSSRYVIVYLVGEESLRRLYAEDASELGTLYVMDVHGIVVSHANASLISHPSELFSETWFSAENYHTAVSDTGEKYFIACSPIGSSNLYLVSEMLASDIVADISGLSRLMYLCVALTAVFLIPASIFLIRLLLRPMNRLFNSMRRMEKGEFDQSIKDVPPNEIGQLIVQFNEMARSIRHLTRLNEENAAKRREAELQALQAYINPHFLHNTILTLRYMAVMVNANRLADALVAFGSMLQPLYSTDNPMWSIREERAFIENYLKVMDYRYGGLIKVDVQVGEGLEEVRILKFVVQPMIENAYTYGINPRKGVGAIRIEFMADGEDIAIIVQDEGPGIAEDRLLQLCEALATERVQYGEHGMGLPNVASRIRLYFGSAYRVAIKSGPNGTTVTIRLPYLTGENDFERMSGCVSDSGRRR